MRCPVWTRRGAAAIGDSVCARVCVVYRAWRPVRVYVGRIESKRKDCSGGARAGGTEDVGIPTKALRYTMNLVSCLSVCLSFCDSVSVSVL